MSERFNVPKCLNNRKKIVLERLTGCPILRGYGTVAGPTLSSLHNYSREPCLLDNAYKRINGKKKNYTDWRSLYRVLISPSLQKVLLSDE